MKKLLSNLHFRSIYKTIVLTLLLSFLYNIFYLILSAMHLNVYIKESLQVVLSLVSSIGMYLICCKIWKKSNVTKKALVHVLFLQALFIFIVSGILSNLVTIFEKQTAMMIILQLLSAFVLVTMVPFQLLYYYGLSHEKKLKEWLPKVIKKHQKSLLNWYCTLLICIIIFDTMSGGLFSAASGFNAQGILVGSMYMGNPMMSWMMYLFLGVSFQSSLSSMFAYLFLNFMLGFIYCILELNYIGYVGRLADADQ